MWTMLDKRKNDKVIRTLRTEPAQRKKPLWQFEKDWFGYERPAVVQTRSVLSKKG